MFCTNCGNQLKDNDEFCSKCGAKKINKISVQLENVIITESVGKKSSKEHVFSDEDFFSAYITGSTIKKEDKSFFHFITAFKKFEKSGSKINWNLCGCIFDWQYLAYRKAYLAGILSYIGTAILLAVNIPLLSVILLFGCFLFFGFFSDYILYSRYKNKRIEAEQLFPGKRTEQLNYIAKKGGVSIPILVVFIIGGIIVTIICAAAIMLLTDPEMYTYASFFEYVTGNYGYFVEKVFEKIIDIFEFIL